jgi:serine phosphatase RsbU (regulator of sigma subunit)
LQGNEFSISAAARGSEGEIYLGGVNGFNVFYPTKIKKNVEVPRIEITEFILFNEPVEPGKNSPLKVHINEAEEIVLAYDQNAFTFEFSSLDMSFPHRNQYAYMLEGFDHDWRFTDSHRRFASYTSLPGGEYVFKIVGSNSDGVWNNTGDRIRVTIVPPFWQSWWFISIAMLIIGAISFYMLRKRFKNVRMKIELETAHNAQMSIMPQNDPEIDGIDISGICLPAHEVGGDFFDYLWLDAAKTNLGIAVGDVSGKAMNSAMTAVMTSGMMYSKAEQNKSVAEIMTELNVPIYSKIEKKMFIALCLASIDINTKELTFTNAGLLKPLWKTNGTAEFIECNGPKFPLGTLKDTYYDKKTIRLKQNDVLVIFTDGISDAQNSSREFLGIKRIKNMLKYLDTGNLSASEIKEHIVNETNTFRGSMPQNDDITLVVIKIK